MREALGEKKNWGFKIWLLWKGNRTWEQSGRRVLLLLLLPLPGADPRPPVEIGNVRGATCKIDAGIPQGDVTGPEEKKKEKGFQCNYANAKKGRRERN